MSEKRRKAKDQANREVSFGATIFLSVIFAALGLLLGIVHLALIPATEVREMPKEEDIKARAVYYVRGDDSGASGYRPKERALLEGRAGVYRFNEAELNSWARSTFSFSKPKEEDSGGILKMKPSLPNFRIADGEMQMSMVVEFQLYDLERQKARFQAIGTFVNEGGIWQFKPRKAYLGTAELPDVLIASTMTSVFTGLFESQEKFPTFEDVWLALDGVKVDGRQLILQKR